MNNPGCILMELVRQTAQGTPEQGFGAPALSTGEECFSRSRPGLREPPGGTALGRRGLALAYGLCQLGLGAAASRIP